MSQAGSVPPPSPLRVMFAGGGTGGHLYSGIAVAREAERLCPGVEIVFVGTDKGIEARVLPKEGYRLITLKVSGNRIANDGTVMKPYLVDEVQSPEFEQIEQTEPEALDEAVSSSTANQVRDLMISTVDNGTASPAATAASPAPIRVRMGHLGWSVRARPALRTTRTGSVNTIVQIRAGCAGK